MNRLEQIEEKIDRVLVLLEKPKNPNRVKQMIELNKRLPPGHHSKAAKKRWNK